jgi:hypothetical protein
MPRFRIETELPSTKVTRELVKSLEHFISRRVDALMGEKDDRNEIASALKITITDALGSETMQTIDHFVPTKFPDTTKSIELSFSGPWNSALKGLEIEIQFHKDRQFSRVRVSCENSNPRDLARGMVAGIHECLAPHPAHNAWLHPHALIDGMLIGLAMAIFWVLPSALDYAPLGAVMALATILVFLTCYLWPLRRLRLYTVFDSPVSESRAKWWDWFLKGLIGFIVFGTLLALVRDRLLHMLRGG